MDHYPRYARHKSYGTVRIVEYAGDGFFDCVGPRDERRRIHRSALSFRR